MQFLQEGFYHSEIKRSVLAYNGRELLGHGKEYHYERFGSPIGLLQDMPIPLEDMSDQQLQETRIEKGKPTVLQFASGVRQTDCCCA